MTDKMQQAAEDWFRALRADIIGVLEEIEAEYADKNGGTPGRFEIEPWSREDTSGQPGGGEMGLLRDGLVFEKAGVNVSTVWGKFSPEFRGSIPGTENNDGAFWASGISLVLHPRNPFVPPVHLNTRYIATDKNWFGGGADLNPIYKNDQDTNAFHAALELCCNKYDPTCYAEFKKWADEYFWNKHRNEARGVGGIFFDYLDSDDKKADFEFVQDVGKTFLDIYPLIARAHMFDEYGPEHEAHQLFRRGRYVEFNLLYDRGTVFGLKTGGNPEAILMSLPPRVTW